MHILLCINGPFREEILKEHGNFSVLILEAARKSSPVLKTLDVNSLKFTMLQLYNDEPLPAIEDFDAVILSGSRYMVTDRLEWSERAARWLAQHITGASQQQQQQRNDSNNGSTNNGHHHHRHHHHVVPMLGICYGHQLICDALGGQVEYNPRGHESGSFPVKRVESLCGDCKKRVETDPILTKIGSPTEFTVQAWHKQSVTRLPENSVPLFLSDMDDHQLVAHGNGVWTTQFHPEFHPAVFRTYEPLLSFDGDEDRARFKSSLQESPVATNIIGAFLETAHEIKLQRERLACAAAAVSTHELAATESSLH